MHVLGQDIVDADPRASILGRLELSGWTFHDALSALNLAAEVAGTRALLVIDALNEGHGTEVWRKHLAGFIREVNKHERVVLVMSCREEYLDYVIPEELIAHPHPYPDDDGRQPEDCAPVGKLIQVNVLGFRTKEEREAALRKFMDEKGIARPTAPVLDDEFFNPLFMTSVCRSMARAGERVFPRGLRGAKDIFDFVLETKAKALGTRHDGTMRVYEALRAALDALAGKMVERREDNVPLRDAIDLIDSAFRALTINDNNWLEILEGSDILRRDVKPSADKTNSWSRPNEVIRFAFQRLQDNLFAERLMGDCEGIDIEDALGPDGPLEFLVRRSKGSDGQTLLRFNPRWVSLMGAVWAAVAESHGKEIYDLRSFSGGSDVHYYPGEFRPVFHASIRERRATAFTRRTKETLDKLWDDQQDEKLAIFLSTSCIPGHVWNADFLAERLLSLAPAMRESAWSQWFSSHHSKASDRAMEVIDWALNVDVAAADAQVVRLAGTTLTCLLTAGDPVIRDRATEGLTNLMAGMSTLSATLESQFSAIGDNEVLERLQVASSGQRS